MVQAETREMKQKAVDKFKEDASVIMEREAQLAERDERLRVSATQIEKLEDYIYCGFIIKRFLLCFAQLKHK